MGSGVPGQDGSIASSTSIVNNGNFVVSNVGPTTFAIAITGSGALVQNSPSTLTLTGSNSLTTLVFANSGTVTGGTINLAAGVDNLVNTAPGVTTISSPINLVAGSNNNYWAGGSGTLNIAAPITDTALAHLYLYGGNYTMGNAGSLTIATGYALVVSASGNTQCNFAQSGGLVSINRPSSNGLYLTQGGTGNYTLSGGSLVVLAGATIIGDNANTQTGILTINGAGALASLPTVNLFGAAGGQGIVNLQNGRLLTDSINTTSSSVANSIFNFSGGTLQPLDSGITGFGSATPADNFSIVLSGSGATISSSDSGSVGRTVPVYANLTGGGTLTTIGAGTVVLQGSNSGFTGQVASSAGTLQIGTASTAALGSSLGSVLINGGVLDINGNTVANPGPITLASGSIIDSAGGGVLNAPSYTLQSGTASAVLGGGAASVNKTTSGLALLTAANTYGGPTTVCAGTLSLGASGTLSTAQTSRLVPARCWTFPHGLRRAATASTT